MDDGKFVHELNLTPGSLHDLVSLLLLPLDLPEGAEPYLDQGYESHLYAAFPSGKHLEDLLREAQGVVPMVIRRRNSRRYLPWLQYLAIVGQGVVETVGGNASRLVSPAHPRRDPNGLRHRGPHLRPGPQPEASNSGNGLGSNLG